jgi:hypothetical protein
LVSVIVSTLVSPVPTDAGAKTFVAVSAPRTVSVAFAAAVLAPPLVVVSAPAAIEFAYAPEDALVTFTVIVQEPDAGIVPPESATLLAPLFAVTAPPAQLVAPAGAAVFTRPAGYVSVTAAPVIAVVFGFVSVIVSTEVPFTPTAVGAKALVTIGAESTVSVAVAALAVPVSVVTAPVELRYEPADALVTLTVTVQPPAGTVPPASASELPPFAPVATPPGHVVAGDAEAVFTRPAGYVSVKAAFVTDVAFGLLSVIVSTLVPLRPIVDGVKDLAAVIAARTWSEPLAADVFEPPLVVVNAPIARVFVYVPALALETFTVTVHEPLAGMVPPESATLFPAAAAVTDPPQVVAPDGVAVFTRPAGYVSVNAAPVIGVVLLLVSVIVSTEAVLRPTGLGENDFAAVGRESTVSVAVAAASVPALVVEMAPVLLR